MRHTHARNRHMTQKARQHESASRKVQRRRFGGEMKITNIPQRATRNVIQSWKLSNRIEELRGLHSGIMGSTKRQKKYLIFKAKLNELLDKLIPDDKHRDHKKHQVLLKLADTYRKDISNDELIDKIWLSKRKTLFRGKYASSLVPTALGAAAGAALSTKFWSKNTASAVNNLWESFSKDLSNLEELKGSVVVHNSTEEETTLHPHTYIRGNETRTITKTYSLNGNALQTPNNLKALPVSKIAASGAIGAGVGGLVGMILGNTKIKESDIRKIIEDIDSDQRRPSSSRE
jgi:hypothetical protein